MNAAYRAARRALYGGMSDAEIKARKGIAPDEGLSARMGMWEKAANSFCLTQAEERLKCGGNAQQAAEVGSKIRQTIAELGGTMPEDLPLEERKKRHERRA